MSRHRHPFKQATINTEVCIVTSGLLVFQTFSMDIMRHKDAVDEIVKTANTIMNSKNPEEKEILKVIFFL